MRFPVSAIVLALVFVFSSADMLFGQFVSSGSMPAGVRWMQVEGETYKVIYPDGMDSLATRYLWLLEENSKAVMLGLGGIKPVKVPVVLYNSTVRSNGSVVWAPKRMELFTIPAANGYAQRWEEQLALHESRHVGQMTHFTKGIYKLGSILVGEQAPSIGVAIYPTRWMLEGDAVVAETELSNAGRGRSAAFMEYYRASFLEGEPRSWSQWKLGSYKHYTPNYYTLGYLTNSTIRYESGNYGYAGEVFKSLVKNFYTPFARDVSYVPLVGDVPRRFFRKGREMMTQYWKDELPQRGKITTAEQLIADRGNDYREYLSPVVVGRDSVLYLRYSYNGPSALVMVSGGKENVLRSFAANVRKMKKLGEKVYFVEQIPHPRWTNVVYGNMYSYDWKSGEMEELGRGKFLGAVQTDEASGRVAVVEYMSGGGTSLVLTDAVTGEMMESIPAPENGEITGSAWLEGELYATVITGKGLGIFRYSEGCWSSVLQEQSASIEELQGSGDCLYFLSDMDGVRNVYSYNPRKKKLGRVTNSLYGASEPLVEGEELYYSSLETGGRYPVKIALDTVGESGSRFTPWVEEGILKGQYRYFVADTLSAQARRALAEGGMLASEDGIGQKGGTSFVKYSQNEAEFAATLQPRRYSQLGHLFRFHSWAPVYYDVERIMETDYDNLHEVVSLGATAYSQNTLGTAVTMLGYSYRDGFNAGHIKMKYTGWYPSLQFSADVNNDHRYGVRIEREGNKIKRSVEKLSSPLVELSAMAYLPLNLSSHGWNRAIVPQVEWDFNNNGYYDSSKEGYINSHTLTSSFQFYVMREMAHSGIFPKWGIGGVARWRMAIDGGENFGSSHSLHLYGYMPGAAPAHGLKLSLSAQKQNVDGKNYFMSNMVNMPRGCDDVYGEKYFSGTIDYAMPFYLGDKNIIRLLYLKRLQFIPFADFAVVDSRNIHSYGTAVMVDFAPFTIGVDLSFGVRYSFNMKTAQVLFSTALF